MTIEEMAAGAVTLLRYVTASIRDDVGSDFEAGEHLTGLITLVERAPEMVPQAWIVELERHLEGRDDIHARVGLRACREWHFRQGPRLSAGPVEDLDNLFNELVAATPTLSPMALYFVRSDAEEGMILLALASFVHGAMEAQVRLPTGLLVRLERVVEAHRGNIDDDDAKVLIRSFDQFRDTT